MASACREALGAILRSIVGALGTVEPALVPHGAARAQLDEDGLLNLFREMKRREGPTQFRLKLDKCTDFFSDRTLRLDMRDSEQGRKACCNACLLS